VSPEELMERTTNQYGRAYCELERATNFTRRGHFLFREIAAAATARVAPDSRGLWTIRGIPLTAMAKKGYPRPDDRMKKLR
jgi:hypothetical protein